MFMAQAPYASTYVGGYDRRGWTQVQIPAKGSVTIGGPIDKDICFHMGGTEYISNTTVKRLTEYLIYCGPLLLRLGAITGFDGYCVSGPWLLRFEAMAG